MHDLPTAHSPLAFCCMFCSHFCNTVLSLTRMLSCRCTTHHMARCMVSFLPSPIRGPTPSSLASSKAFKLCAITLSRSATPMDRRPSSHRISKRLHGRMTVYSWRLAIRSCPSGECNFIQRACVLSTATLFSQTSTISRSLTTRSQRTRRRTMHLPLLVGVGQVFPVMKA